MTKHSERCKLCKETVARLLAWRYGEVRERVSLGLPARPEDYKDTACFEALGRIHESLQDYRGHLLFVRTPHLPPIDYHVPDPGLVVEFDESQHFTQARLVSLRHYPSGLPLGFDRDRWIELCLRLDRHDNDPPYRDEQRAWYDTLRDFSPLVLGNLPTVLIVPVDQLFSTSAQPCPPRCLLVPPFKLYLCPLRSAWTSFSPRRDYDRISAKHFCLAPGNPVRL